MAPRRRTTTAVTALAAAALAVPLLTGCGAVEKAFDCARTAATITEAVSDLQQAATDAAENPAESIDALDRIERNVDTLGKETDDADLSKAVEKLDTAVQEARDAIKDNRTPDLTPITDAAGEITQVCSPG
ncbi:hypothetical protein DMH02_008135 [Streptomyces sp. WAC 00631]|uniref:hypothetical protein n=1 Tax=unclassified Streptomyces TaxID=2593676 RepID=UPI000F7B9CF1|nr:MULTISPECIES: hypothetical protein [unclassified Streptomyces]MCC5033189.1 hypothetical protein [Streptomyces sp. WAC 00631]MCC9741267.1 hypothetical protein [Streptomyces sp. MNU89]